MPVFLRQILKPAIMRKIFLLALLAGFVLFTASCGYVGGKRVRGNGTFKSESRSVTAFQRLEVSGAADVVLKQDAALNVKVEGDENLLPYIEVENDGGTLRVRTRRNYNLQPRTKLVIYISSPDFKDIQVSGAGEIKSEGKLTSAGPFNFDLSGAGEIKLDVDAPKIAVDVSGAGNITMQGKTRDLDLEVSGAGNVHCYNLLSENTKLSISGAGDAEVYASVKLTGHVSGAGEINYKGGGTSEVSTSGAGSVHKKD
jgi:Putative auto-transporter adhesin, head GIN domain